MLLAFLVIVVGNVVLPDVVVVVVIFGRDGAIVEFDVVIDENAANAIDDDVIVVGDFVALVVVAVGCVAIVKVVGCCCYC